MYIMWALQYIHDNLLKWYRDCWAMHTKWYPSVRIMGFMVYQRDYCHEFYGISKGFLSWVLWYIKGINYLTLKAFCSWVFLKCKQSLPGAYFV